MLSECNYLQLLFRCRQAGIIILMWAAVFDFQFLEVILGFFFFFHIVKLPQNRNICFLLGQQGANDLISAPVSLWEGSWSCSVSLGEEGMTSVL